MPSKTSSLNKELILQIVRSTGWISIIYFLGLIFAVPLKMLMMYTSEVEYIGFVNSIFEYNIEIQIILLLGIPVLLAVFLFRFLHVKQNTDLMHSLPISRRKIFHHYALSGIISLMIPVVLVGIIVSIVHAALDLDSYFQLKDVLYWTGTTLIFNLIFLTAGIFVAMMTGISAVQGVLTYVLLLFPAGITLIVLYNLKLQLFGFPSDYYLNRNIETISPFTRAITMMEGNVFQLREGLIYLVLIVVLYGLSLYFYQKRNVESATEAIAFRKLHVVFKYGFTFCMMLIGGMYFGEVQNSFVWALFGYVVGAIIGYYLAEMLLEKTWRVFSRVKGLAIYAVSVAILMGGIQTLGFYENRIPALEEVENVIFSDSPFIHRDEEIYGFQPKPIKEQENIEAIRKLHQQIVDDKHMNGEMENSDYTRTAFFLYELETGKKVIRQYRVNEKVYEDFYKPIYESVEYKKVTNEIFHLQGKQIDSISIHPNAPGKRNLILNREEEVKEIIETLQADILAESYEDSSYYNGRGSTIEFVVEKDHYVYMNLNPTYKKLNQWLEDKGLLAEATVVPEDIASIHVAEWTNDGNLYPETAIENIENQPNVLKVTDKDEIGGILDSATGWGRSHQYIAVLEFENGSYKEELYLDEEHAPAFIKNHFK